MKTKFTILILSLSLLSCSKGKQPKCSEDIVVSLLKEIIAPKVSRDTSEISISGIRTISKDEEFKSCTCGAQIQAKTKMVGSAFFINPIDESINFTAQLTDDGENMSVTINDK
jgi:hypothetical protein